MKCSKCGHNYPDTLSYCTKCKEQNPRRLGASRSKLIEFPRQPRPSPQQECAGPPWRAEVVEKVRAARAKRDSIAQPAPAEAAPQQNSALENAPLNNRDKIVEAVLNRIQQASQLAKISAISAGRDSTAKVLEPIEEPNFAEAEASPPELEPPPAAPAKRADAMSSLDYLEAEIKRVDEALSQELARPRGAPLLGRAVSAAIDLAIFAISCAPFIASIWIAGGDFSKPGTKLAIALIAFLISFFYLMLTHCLCGKTLGMALTNTRVIDAETQGQLSCERALLRVIGYYLAAIPLGIGFFWAAFRRDRRGWQDLFSRTMVVSDF